MLVRRGRKYYARVHVPKDMLELFGRAELKKSLKTEERREAKAAAAALHYTAQAAFLRVRTGMLTDRELEKIAVELISEFCGKLETHKRQQKDVMEWLFTDEGGLLPSVDPDLLDAAFQYPRVPADLAAQVTWYSERIEALQTEAALGHYSRDTRKTAGRIVAAKKLDIEMPTAGWFSDPTFVMPARYDAEFNEYSQEVVEPPSAEEMKLWNSAPPPEFDSLCAAILHAQIDACNLSLERAQAKRGTPLQARMEERMETAKPKPRLGQLWEVYRDSSKENWTEGSLERNNGVFAQIVDILGDLELSELEDERQAIKLRDMLRLYPSSKEKKPAFKGKPFKVEMAKHKDFKPLGLSGQIKAVDLTSSIMKFALRNPKRWGITCNVFAGSQPKDTRPENSLRNEYRPEDILKLIEALKTTRPVRQPERFWIPLLGLYTGMRQNEICQLRTADVCEVGGIWYFDICHKPELDQRTKKEKSRTCPIHPALIELGFLHFVSKQTHDRLWPNLKLSKIGKWQHEFSKWYCGTFSKKFTNPAVRKLDFHGLRHTFLNWYKQNAGLEFNSYKLLKSVVGHLDNFDAAILGAVADDMTSDRYGKDYQVEKQYELLSKLDYSVDLGVLKYKL